eukprot:jgi/Botrbrau1/22588/Bobra.176_1s0018.1
MEWEALLQFSPFSFRDPELERAFNRFQTAYVATSAWSASLMSTMAWGSLLVTLHMTFPPNLGYEVVSPLVVLVAITSSTLMLLLLWRNYRIYLRWWQLWNATQHLVFQGVSIAMWRHFLRSYAATGFNPQPGHWGLHFLREYLIEQPWLASQAIVAFLVQVNFLVHAGVLALQLPIYMAQIPSYCTSDAAFPHMVSRYPELAWVLHTVKYVTASLSPSVVGKEGMQFSAFDPALQPDPFSPGSAVWEQQACFAHMAFWQIMSTALCMLLTLVREVRMRQNFLKARVGPRQSRNVDWPMRGTLASLRTWRHHCCLSPAAGLHAPEAGLPFGCGLGRWP